MIIYADKDVTTIEKTCPFCGKTYESSFPSEGYGKWMGGELIQKAMPAVPATVREWLISGICLGCQSSIFGEED